MELLKEKSKDWNYKYVGSFDVSKIIKSLESLGIDDWADDRTFQKLKPSESLRKQPHIETNYIRVLKIFYDKDGNPFKNNLASKYGDLYGHVEELSNQIISSYLDESYFWSSANFAQLPSGSRVHEHIDSHPYYRMIRRLHVSIAPAGISIFGGEAKEYELGECYEVNNTKDHGAENFSDKDRVLLIIDFLSTPDYIHYLKEDKGKQLFPKAQ